MYPHQRERLSAILAGQGLAALVTTARLNIAWATSTLPDTGAPPRALVVTADHSVLVAEAHDPGADALGADEVVRYGAGRRGTPAEALGAVLAVLKIGAREAVALDGDAEDALGEAKLAAALGARDVRPGHRLWRGARAVKSPFELDCLERGLVVLEEALNAAVQVLAPGMTAPQTVELCEREAARHGMTFPHALVAAVDGGRRAFRSGDLLRLELSGSWKGYHALVARAAVLGVPSTAQDGAHATLEAPLTTAVHTIGPGVPGSAVYAAGAGLAPGIEVSGAGIGLEPREAPALAPDSDDRLEPGMVVTVGTAAPGRLRLVDTVLVTSRSFRRLNRSHAALVALD